MRTDRSIAMLCLLVPQLALAQGTKATAKPSAKPPAATKRAPSAAQPTAATTKPSAATTKPSAGTAKPSAATTKPSAPAAKPPPASAKPAAAPASQAPAAAADPEVRSLEERVSDLKEKIYRTKARLMNLQEMVIGGDVATGTQAVVVHRNEMGSSYRLESVRYSLDGSPVFTDSGGSLHDLEEVEVFNGRVAPGDHQLAVQLVYRGDGHGVFSYVDGYRFEVDSAYSFSAEPGKTSTVEVIGFEKGGFTTALEERPSVRYGLSVRAVAPPPAGEETR